MESSEPEGIKGGKDTDVDVSAKRVLRSRIIEVDSNSVSSTGGTNNGLPEDANSQITVQATEALKKHFQPTVEITHITRHKTYTSLNMAEKNEVSSSNSIDINSLARDEKRLNLNSSFDDNESVLTSSPKSVASEASGTSVRVLRNKVIPLSLNTLSENSGIEKTEKSGKKTEVKQVNKENHEDDLRKCKQAVVKNNQTAEKESDEEKNDKKEKSLGETSVPNKGNENSGREKASYNLNENERGDDVVISSEILNESANEKIISDKTADKEDKNNDVFNNSEDKENNGGDNINVDEDEDEESFGGKLKLVDNSMNSTTINQVENDLDETLNKSDSVEKAHISNEDKPAEESHEDESFRKGHEDNDDEAAEKGNEEKGGEATRNDHEDNKHITTGKGLNEDEATGKGCEDNEDEATEKDHENNEHVTIGKGLKDNEDEATKKDHENNKHVTIGKGLKDNEDEATEKDHENNEHATIGKGLKDNEDVVIGKSHEDGKDEGTKKGGEDKDVATKKSCQDDKGEATEKGHDDENMEIELHVNVIGSPSSTEKDKTETSKINDQKLPLQDVDSDKGSDTTEEFICVNKKVISRQPIADPVDCDKSNQTQVCPNVTVAVADFRNEKVSSGKVNTVNLATEKENLSESEVECIISDSDESEKEEISTAIGTSKNKSIISEHKIAHVDKVVDVNKKSPRKSCLKKNVSSDLTGPNENVKEQLNKSLKDVSKPKINLSNVFNLLGVTRKDNIEDSVGNESTVIGTPQVKSKSKLQKTVHVKPVSTQYFDIEDTLKTITKQVISEALTDVKKELVDIKNILTTLQKGKKRKRHISFPDDDDDDDDDVVSVSSTTTTDQIMGTNKLTPLKNQLVQKLLEDKEKQLKLGQKKKKRKLMKQQSSETVQVVEEKQKNEFPSDNVTTLVNKIVNNPYESETVDVIDTDKVKKKLKKKLKEANLLSTEYVDNVSHKVNKSFLLSETLPGFVDVNPLYKKSKFTDEAVIPVKNIDEDMFDVGNLQIEKKKKKKTKKKLDVLSTLEDADDDFQFFSDFPKTNSLGSKLNTADDISTINKRIRKKKNKDKLKNTTVELDDKIKEEEQQQQKNVFENVNLEKKIKKKKKKKTQQEFDVTSPNEGIVIKKKKIKIIGKDQSDTSNKFSKVNLSSIAKSETETSSNILSSNHFKRKIKLLDDSAKITTSTPSEQQMLSKKKKKKKPKGDGVSDIVNPFINTDDTPIKLSTQNTFQTVPTYDGDVLMKKVKSWKSTNKSNLYRATPYPKQKERK